MDQNPLPGVPSCDLSNFQGSSHTSGRRSRQSTSEGSSGSGRPMCRPVHQLAISSIEEGQVIQASDQPQATEHLHPEGTFQDGGGQHDQRPFTSRGLDALFGPQGCLPCSPNCQGTLQISLFFVEWQIFMSPIWAVQCSTRLHEASSTSNGSPALPGSTDHHLLRQHLSDTSGQDGTLPRSGSDVQLTGTIGIHDQPTHITDYTSTEDPILGVPSGFNPDEALASPREDRQHNTDVPEPAETATSHSPSTVSVAGENNSSCTSRSFSPYTIQTSAETENTALDAFQIIQPDRLPEQGVNEQTSLVVRKSNGMEWQRNCPATTRPCDRDGCLSDRLGGCMRGSANRGPVVSGRTAGTYQCTGADCRHVCCTGFRKRQEESPCSPQDGQHICSYLCDQDEGTQSIKLTAFVCQIWDWCLQRQITLSQRHTYQVWTIRSQTENLGKCKHQQSGSSTRRSSSKSVLY